MGSSPELSQGGGGVEEGDFLADQLAEAQRDPVWRAKWTPDAKGPIRILCDEIGFEFDRRLERPDVLVAFVRGLVAEIAHERDVARHIAKYTGKAPAIASAKVLKLAGRMLKAKTAHDLIACAGLVHDACHDLNPDDAYPTDHTIDMLSSCASAIRFGLESPCRSRHAASAASHVWKRLYGISRFDSHTPAWEKAWARSCLQNAIISLLRAPTKAAADTSDRPGQVPGRKP